MIRLSELLDESDASEEARRLGLTHAGYGRYKDKSGNITHMSQDGKLVPVDAAAPDDATRISNLEKQKKDIEADRAASPGRRDWSQTSKRSWNKQYKTDQELDKLKGVEPKKHDYDPIGKWSTGSNVTMWGDDKLYSDDAAQETFQGLAQEKTPEEFAEFIKPYLVNPRKAEVLFSAMLNKATDLLDTSNGQNENELSSIIMNSGMALKVLNRIERGRESPNVNKLSSMMPVKTPDQLEDPEDFEKNRDMDNILSADDETDVELEREVDAASVELERAQERYDMAVRNFELDDNPEHEQELEQELTDAQDEREMAQERYHDARKKWQDFLDREEETPSSSPMNATQTYKDMARQMANRSRQVRRK